MKLEVNGVWVEANQLKLSRVHNMRRLLNLCLHQPLVLPVSEPGNGNPDHVDSAVHYDSIYLNNNQHTDRNIN